MVRTRLEYVSAKYLSNHYEDILIYHIDSLENFKSIYEHKPRYIDTNNNIITDKLNLDVLI